MFCPKCRAEYVDGITVCADCGVPLVEKLPEEKEKHLILPEYVELLYTHDAGLIAIIKSILDNADITYIFQGDSYAYLHPTILPARLFVRKKDAQKARDLLKDFIQSNNGNGV
jgi:hypothetical protein